MAIPNISKGSGQRGYEYKTWIALCLAMGVKRYVELGSWDGTTATIARDSGIERVVTIDITSGRPSALREDMGFVSANSSSPEALQGALDFLEGFPDAVFVDANHDEGPVRKDFALWWPVTTTLLAFHDIRLTGRGVLTFWEEISQNIRSVEIVAREEFSNHEYGQSHPSPWAGIGILFKKSKPEE